MSKAAIQDITDAGFQAQQFGNVANFLTANTGIVALLLAEASAWASEYVGASVYAAAVTPSLGYFKLLRAEIAYASSDLWRKRAAYLDSGATIGRQDSVYLDRREMLAHADAAMATAQALLAEAAQALGVDPSSILPGTGISVGHIETGRYPIASDVALNG